MNQITKHARKILRSNPSLSLTIFKPKVLDKLKSFSSLYIYMNKLKSRPPIILFSSISYAKIFKSFKTSSMFNVDKLKNLKKVKNEK